MSTEATDTFIFRLGALIGIFIIMVMGVRLVVAVERIAAVVEAQADCSEEAP